MNTVATSSPPLLMIALTSLTPERASVTSAENSIGVPESAGVGLTTIFVTFGASESTGIGISSILGALTTASL